MKKAYIEAEKAAFPVVVLCSALGVARSGFYAWPFRPACKRKRSDSEPMAAI